MVSSLGNFASRALDLRNKADATLKGGFLSRMFGSKQDRADEATIIPMIQKLMSGINSAFSNHDIKILTPEERGSRYKRRTFGSDTEDHSDTSLMAHNVSMRFNETDFRLLLPYIIENSDKAKRDWNKEVGVLMGQTVGIHLGQQRDLF